MEMRDKKFKKSDLDAVGKQLFASAKLTDAEIDRIAAGPALFDAVRARISAEPVADRESARGRLGVLTAYKTVLGTSLAAVLCLTAVAVYLQQDNPGAVATGTDITAPPSHAAPSHSASKVNYIKGFTQGTAEILEEPPAPVQTTVQYADQHETRRPSPRVERAAYTAPRRADFVAVTYTGDGGESARGGRVVRVDVPRSTLFAMGFNVSLENDSPTVKADLLIGPDGVTRAVRLVE